ncbi:MAG: hypothetical protein FWG73_05475 [Planctomycetaceae bacterium]|nr:hypothetical protein [Planctomycetaceae bacterium]
MFEWRFRITPGIIPQPFLETAYFAGWGRVPQLTLATVQRHELILYSESYTSGTVHVPILHPSVGVFMEATESLLGRSEPYFLLRELTRGAFGRLYRRLFDWKMLGFRQPKELDEQVQQLAKHFSSLIVQDSFSCDLEQEFVFILNELAPLIVHENRHFAEQSLAWRTRNGNRLPVLLGIGMNAQHPETPHPETLHEFDAYAKLLQDSFHLALPMPTWRELEPLPGQFHWERLEQKLLAPSRFGMRVVLGPLLSFSADTLPYWLLQSLTEEDSFETEAIRFVNSIAERYGYLAHSWILANRFSCPSLPEIPPDRSLALTRVLAQQLRKRGIQTPMMVGITQPWGEYSLRHLDSWEQIRVAEALLSFKDIDAFLLEMDFGFDYRQTFPRDPMSIGNMIDHWSFLGKKVYVSLSIPSAGTPITRNQELPSEAPWSLERQRTWTEMLLLTFLGKRAVRGIFWTCMSDPARPSDFATEYDYGLLDSHQVLKPAFRHFRAVRKNLLQD